MTGEKYIITEKLAHEIDEHLKNNPDCISDRISRVMRSNPLPARDAAIAAKAREKVLDEIGLNCFGEYQMNNRRCMVCQVGERCYDKRQSLRSNQQEREGE